MSSDDVSYTSNQSHKASPELGPCIVKETLPPFTLHEINHTQKHFTQKPRQITHISRPDRSQFHFISS